MRSKGSFSQCCPMTVSFSITATAAWDVCCPIVKGLSWEECKLIGLSEGRVHVAPPRLAPVLRELPGYKCYRNCCLPGHPAHSNPLPPPLCTQPHGLQRQHKFLRSCVKPSQTRKEVQKHLTTHLCCKALLVQF